jgi:serine/threonine-protein kinase
MATVYLAKAVGQGGFERQVAVKVMHPHIAHDPDSVRMFLDEARLAALIDHPNVVPTLDVQTDGGETFMAMAYVDGASLQAVLRQLGETGEAMDIGVALRIAIDFLTGLHAAHELVGSHGAPLHIVHRDVSPHNVMVGRDGISRITDFGVAHAEARLATTATGQIKGKLAYMSPEQVTGKELDRRSDVYAAGVVLWEMLTGRRLFKASNEGEVILRILEGPKQTPSEVRGDVPEPIATACMRALASLGQRFGTAGAMAEALREAAAAAGIAVASPEGVSRLVARVRASDDSVDESTLATTPDREPPADLGAAETTPPFSGTGDGSGTRRVAVLPSRRRTRAQLFWIGGIALFAATLGLLSLRGSRSDDAAAAPRPAPLAVSPAAAPETARLAASAPTQPEGSAAVRAAPDHAESPLARASVQPAVTTKPSATPAPTAPPVIAERPASAASARARAPKTAVGYDPPDL